MEKIAAFREWLVEQAAQAPLPNLTSIEAALQVR